MKSLFSAFICLLLTIPCAGEIALIDINREDGYGISPLLQESTKSTQLEYVPNEIIVKFREDVTEAIEEQLAKGVSGSELELADSLDKLNKKYKVRAAKALCKDFKKSRQRIKELLKANKTLLTKRERRILRRLNRAPKDVIVPDLDRIYKIEVELESGQSLERAVQEYQSNPNVEYAELNFLVSTCVSSNDPLYPIQWPLNNTGQVYPESGRYNHPPGTPDSDIDAPEAWDIYTGSSEIIIAVVDTGVDYTHRDLQANMWVNADEIPGNGLDDDGNGYVDDIYGYDFFNNDADPKDDAGHGTHCSGTIAAIGNNGLDIAGVCWNAKIMALKFLSSEGTGSNSDAVEAFYYAVENGADVTSNSWGGGSYSQAMEEAINYAHSQGVIMVASAGNDGDTEYQYPAYYDHMISVAATNSNDECAPFSTYGDWVDIAAPGVDVLSLRASGTSGGTPYNQYTTIMSGTSMACPHVAGACALLLSIYPKVDLDQLEVHLEDSADPIDPNICVSGRLNLNEAMLQIVSSEGKVCFDREAYSCIDTVLIGLFDFDLAGDSNQQVIVSTEGGDFETVLLTGMAPYVGIFEGAILTDSNVSVIGDGVLQVSHDHIITVTYDDANNGMGIPVTVTDEAVVDCQAPIVFDVRISFPGRQPKVTFKTDEPTTGRILCGFICGGPYIIDKADLTLTTSHTIELTGVVPETRYFFIIEADDAAGNRTTENNHNHCYKFTTTGVGDIHVPAQCPTIQEAIDNSWDGGVVLIADGIYTGVGNRDIDFKRRPILVSSENGPKSCIIDCEGTESESHRGFYFHFGEDSNSVLKGITITNGYIPGSWYVGIGGGILCRNNSCPTITNCIFARNVAGWDGGGICNLDSSPNIDNCTFTANSAVGNDGGAINNEFSSPVITNCIFTANSAYDWGGAVRNIYYSDPIFTNCVFTGNSADDGGAMYYYFFNEPKITNCTFAGNTAQYGNAIASNTINNIQITNSIFADGADEIWNDYLILKITYSDISGWAGIGNIDADPCFVDPGCWVDINDHNTVVEPSDPNAVWIEGDYHLREDSLCIDVGDPNYVSKPNETDLDGNSRVIGGRIDMGAYEFVPPVQVEMKITPQMLNCKSKGNWLKTYFVLPEGFTSSDVEVSKPAFMEVLDIAMGSEYVKVFGNDDGLVRLEIAFDRQVLCDLLADDSIVSDDDSIEITVIGCLTNSRYFYGCDNIRIKHHLR